MPLKNTTIFEIALKEDLAPDGDLSTKFFDSKPLKAKLLAKEDGILACTELIEEVFKAYESLTKNKAQLEIHLYKQNSEAFKKGDLLLEIKADSHALLICERTILNFLQRCCAVATKAHELNSIIKDYSCKILDTRKTSPGMRELEKLAFKYGGGTNHRFNLSDMAMLKENHLSLLETDLEKAIESLQNKGCKIEVEINKENLDKLELVCKKNIAQIMLDNFLAEELPDLVEKIRNLNPQIKIEASGGITAKNIEAYAKTGIDYLSTAEASRACNIDLSILMGG